MPSPADTRQHPPERRHRDGPSVRLPGGADNAAALSQTVDLPDAEATARLGRLLAPHLRTGDAVLLEGPLGAGKSHLARALIQHLMAAAGRVEDVPSPTYTLVQTYDVGALRILHADLYRLDGPGDVAELGLADALADTLCLIEWPDRLGRDAPGDALTVTMGHAGDGRKVTLTGGPDWAGRLAGVADG